MIETGEVRDAFEREFGALAGKFEVIELRGPDAARSVDPRVGRPGVYVHWKNSAVIRVGRSFSHARKRALEHLSDDTGHVMGALKDDPGATLILFTVEREADCHWIAALELYFERQLRPLVPPKRRG